jgi:hypothetical protein
MSTDGQPTVGNELVSVGVSLNMFQKFSVEFS